MFLSSRKIFRFFILLMVGFFSASCSFQVNDNDRQNDRDVRHLDNRRDQDRDRSDSSSSRRRSSGSCRNSNGELTIRTNEDISSKNAGDYPLSGQCESSQNRIQISIGGDEIEVDCLGRRWSVDLDVTGVVQGDESVSISVSSGSDEACVVVDNYFLCPENYIPVPRLEGYTDDDFCVMVYEAQNEYGEDSRSRRGFYDRNYDRNRNRNRNRDRDRDRDRDQDSNYAKAVSESGGEPWVSVSRQQAIQGCRNNGIGYDLISNDHWQTIARHIEYEDRNWSLGKSVVRAGNNLNTGRRDFGDIYRSFSRNRDSYSSRNRNSYSRNRDFSSENPDWSVDRRFHILPNGSEIWDFAGGVWELLEDSTNTLGVKREGDKHVAEIRNDRGNKKLFGPQSTYSFVYGRSSNRDNAGLGYAYLSNVEDVVARGGSTERDSGVFSVRANIRDSRSSDSRIGFRCIYNP